MNLIKKLKFCRRKIIFFLKFKIKIDKMRNKTRQLYFCLNSAVHGNMGDQALGFCRIEFLKTIGIDKTQIIEFTSRDEDYFKEFINKVVNINDVLLLRGGGCWGDLWFDGFQRLLYWIKAFSKNKIIVFPQSVYFSKTESGENIKKLSQEIVSQCSNLHIFARDYDSYDKLKLLYPNTKIWVTPDTVLSYKPTFDYLGLQRKGIILCIRKDKESILSIDRSMQIKKIVKSLNQPLIYQDTVINFNLCSIKERKVALERLWEKFSKVKLVITDRLHGMIFSTITGTPCIVFDNIDGKIGHQFEFIKDLGYVRFVNSEENLGKYISEFLELDNTVYPVEKLFIKFSDLEDVLLNKKD